MAGRIGALLEHLRVNPRSAPFNWEGTKYRTPTPNSQKPRDFSLDRADKSENLSSIYYYPRGYDSRIRPTAQIYYVAQTRSLENPKQVAEQKRLVAEKKSIEEATAAGKKLEPWKPVLSLTPIIDYRELEVDVAKIPNWELESDLERPPGDRDWCRPKSIHSMDDWPGLTPVRN